MKIFLDSANPTEVKEAWETGMIDGVTTNPTLATKAGVSFKEAVMQILNTVKGPVNLEVLSTEYAQMVQEAKLLSALASNVVVKVPMTPDGIKTVQMLKPIGIKTNVTLVFSLGQALLAAKAGADYVSPFMGRLDDISEDGLTLVSEIREMYDRFAFDTSILAASERSARECMEAGLLGADIVTMKYTTFKNLFTHPLTDQGLEKFMTDWRQSGEEPIV